MLVPTYTSILSPGSGDVQASLLSLTATAGGKPGGRIKNLRTGVAKAIKRAELPEGFVLHDLRHRRATTWLADGQNVVHVKEALGHADLRTTMGYTHLAKEHLRSLVEERPELGRDESRAS